MAALALCWLAALLLAAPAPAAAPVQDGVSVAADNQPMRIEADSGIEWQQNAHLYIARGNAVATRGDSEVHADTLIARYRDRKGAGGGKTEIYRLEADGHVRLKRGTQTVVGDHAIYDVDQGVAVVTGKRLKLTTASDTVTARDSLEWYEQKQIAVARGDAVATRDGKTVKADVLTAYMTKASSPAATPAGATRAPRRAPSQKTAGLVPAQSRISRIDAQGHVVITNGTDTGRGDYGVYNAETDIATLIGDVVLARGKDVIRGQRGVMDLKRNISRMLPGHGPGQAHRRVEGLFVREQNAENAKKRATGATHLRAPAARGEHAHERTR